MAGISTHSFLGSNSSRGFYSFFRYLIGQEEANKIICLKGGPGTGKSSLMKKLGQHFNEKGYDVEFHHCSSDSDSLDGIVIKALKIALVDGTAPHVIDPITPGAVDQIIDLGHYWKEDGIRKYKKEIMDINKEVGKLFRRSYRYFAAAKDIHDDWSIINNEALDYSQLNLLKEELKDKVFTMPISKLGTERHLFATALTPKGVITYIDTIYYNYKNIYVLNGEPGTGKTELLKFLSEEALRRGLKVELFHDPFIPERIEHLAIPEISTIFLTSNEINQKNFQGNNIYMEDYVNKSVLDKYKEHIDYDKDMFYTLFNKGLDTLTKTKKIRDTVEKYYVSNMDFNKINLVYKDLVEKINTFESN